MEKLWFLGEEWRQDLGRCFQDSVTTSKAWPPLRRFLVEGEGKWKLNSRVWSKGRKGQDKLQTNRSSPYRFYGQWQGFCAWAWWVSDSYFLSQLFSGKLFACLFSFGKLTLQSKLISQTPNLSCFLTNKLSGGKSKVPPFTPVNTHTEDFPEAATLLCSPPARVHKRK